MAEDRNREVVQHEIAIERQQLAVAVERLRDRVAEATDVKRQVKSRLPVIVPAVAAVGFVLLGGIGATRRLVARLLDR